MASVKPDKIYIKGPLVSRSDFYLPAQTAVHLLFTFPIKEIKKPHQLSWVSRFKRQQQELGGIAGKEIFAKYLLRFRISRNLLKNR
ncbi:hypothetical protein QUB69_11160 [Microcoleus sp. AT13-A6]|uniref:hypothetical protein n=1 Tax=unclassified Microcoleus TaxID=2642155 RepID=UPI002FCF30B6